MMLRARLIEHGLAVGTACALCLLASPSHAQETACSTDSSGGVETCVANVVRIPAANRLACTRTQESEVASNAERASAERDKAAARQRVAEARMDDAEEAVPADHTDLEESFDAARSRVAAEESLDRAPLVAATPGCTTAAPDAASVNRQDTVEITFDAPEHCLQTLQRSLEGDQPIAVQIVGRHNLRDATARLIDVETFIEFGVSSARARAALSNPTGLELNDDTVVVRLQCR